MTDVVLTLHVFATGYKRERHLQGIEGLDRTEEDYQAADRNWRLSRTINMPYPPVTGTRIAVPLAAQEEKRYDKILEEARINKVPRIGVPMGYAVFVVEEVTFWLADGLDHAHCELEVPSQQLARYTLRQLEDGFGFKREDY